MRSALVRTLVIIWVTAVANSGHTFAIGKGLDRTLLSKASGKFIHSGKKIGEILARTGVIALACVGLSCSGGSAPPAVTGGYASSMVSSAYVDTKTEFLAERQRKVDGDLSTAIYRRSVNYWHDNEEPLTVFDWKDVGGELALVFTSGESYSSPYPANTRISIVYDNTVKVILTFDDGPDTRAGLANGTQRILDTLENLDINAVFFIQSHARDDNNNYFRGMEEDVGIPLVEQMHKEKHIIAVHTGMDGQMAHAWANRHTRREAIGKLGKDLDCCKEYIRDRTGSYPRYVRPPFGDHNRAVRSQYASRNLNMILWDIDSRDTTSSYDRHDIKNHLKSRVKRLMARGNRHLVILFHDIDISTNSPGHLYDYISVVENAIYTSGFNADLSLSREEIHQILADY